MGFFSIFSKHKAQEVPKDDFSEIFTTDLYKSMIDDDDSLIAFYSKKDTWINANKNFLTTLGLKNIDEFKQQYDGIRALFLSEEEEVFTDNDLHWLSYVADTSDKGHSVTMLDCDKKVMQISAKCKKYNDLYVLKLHKVCKLHLAEQKSKDVEKLKSKFLSNIGHEFRTPMNGILGFIELLADTNLDKRQDEYVGMINRSSRNLMANIETLLDLSQMQGGRLKLNSSPFAILSEMEEVAYNFYVQAKGKDIKFLTFIDPKLPQELIGDVKKIKQVMNSLSQNAIKFTPKGGKVIFEVKLLRRHQNGDCSISFMLKDNGKGIAREQMQLILEPFMAGNHADERLGVGLSLSNGLVKLFGSELKIHSEEGEGSTFSFVLEFKESKGQSYKMVPKKKAKVLLLDNLKVDEANFLTTYLRSFGIDVVKSNLLNEYVYDNVDALYIVANQNDLRWIRELTTYSKRVPVILLLDDGEKLETKATHIVDEVIRRPLIPTNVATHLYDMYGIKTLTHTTKSVKTRENITALVAEDNLINQKLVQILLQKYKILVSTASDGNEAVSMCMKNSYDIIFMDIDMPDKNGIEATQEIKGSKSKNVHTPIVALTAMAMDGDKEMLLSEGLDDYISKPLTKEKLEYILEKYLKLKLR